jgi:hypothetical protein
MSFAHCTQLGMLGARTASGHPAAQRATIVLHRPDMGSGTDRK